MSITEKHSVYNSVPYLSLNMDVKMMLNQLFWNLLMSEMYTCWSHWLMSWSKLTVFFLCHSVCPDKEPGLQPWMPGHSEDHRVTISNNRTVLLTTSATVHSIEILSGGKLDKSIMSLSFSKLKWYFRRPVKKSFSIGRKLARERKKKETMILTCFRDNKRCLIVAVVWDCGLNLAEPNTDPPEKSKIWTV